MPVQSIALVSSTTVGVPAGNYDGSSTSFYSDNEKGDGYFGYTDGLHTVAYRLSNFVGRITIQASLATTPSTDDTDWFTVVNELGDGSTALTQSSYANFTGNFVWVRVKVTDFTAGSINSILYNF